MAGRREGWQGERKAGFPNAPMEKKCQKAKWLSEEALHPSSISNFMTKHGMEPKKIKSDTVSTVSPSISHEVMGPDAMIFVF